MFKGSYGAEMTKSNVFIKFNSQNEIIGTAINISYKIASSKENLQSLFIGNKLSSKVLVHKEVSFNVIKGIQYPAYKYKSSSTTNDPLRNIELVLNKRINIVDIKNDGAIYFMFDIKDSTKALLNFNIHDIAIKHLKTLSKVHYMMKKIGYKSEFRGDGILFWKHNVKINSFQMAISTLNNIENSLGIRGLLSLENAKNRREDIALFATKSLNIRMGIDASEQYNYINSKEPSISKHKVIAEISEKYATRNNKIVAGKSFLSKLYMNDKDCCEVVHTIGGYKLLVIVNKYLKESVKSYKTS